MRRQNSTQNLDSRPNAFFTAVCFIATVSKEPFKKEHIFHGRMKTNIVISVQSVTQKHFLFTRGTACPRPSTSMLVFSLVPSPL